MITTLCIPPDRARDVAIRCADFVVVGLASAPSETLDDVLRRVEARDAQMWVVFSNGQPVSVSFTEIVKGDDGAFVAVFGMSGRNVWKWAQMFADRIVAFARDEGCAVVRFAGKPSWGRLVRNCRVIGGDGGQIVFERSAL